ncbi:tyrosine-type recombinase/integrase [Streptomyces sp. NPDC059499]|uniref:tyrosine-type recombinase/integrase n=1 Tax=Streptomyces sp. NPDC059499 TaxID=3346852 RepID=UPI00367CD434
MTDDLIERRSEGRRPDRAEWKDPGEQYGCDLTAPEGARNGRVHEHIQRDELPQAPTGGRSPSPVSGAGRRLVRHVEERYDRTRTLLDHASAAATDTPFTHDGHTYRRVLTEEDLTLVRAGHRVPVRVRDATGQLVHVEAEEETAFRDWATVETLRHSGPHIEEMCEVSHLSIRHYQRNNGEMVALLVISPSKTDRERVIPMSAELFHVIASVIRRHTRVGSPVPILRRFDPHDKVWSPPMPFLFQRKIGSTRSVISPVSVINMLARRCTDFVELHPEFRSVKFTPHDFRRIFATELVNSGLPIHIGATLLGHLNIQTTRGYVAVFNEDVIAITSPIAAHDARPDRRLS